jgi:hypothetical protein
MPFVLRARNNRFRIRFANVLFEDVPIAIPMRDEKNGLAVSRPIPDVICLVHCQEPGISLLIFHPPRLLPDKYPPENCV